MTSPRSILSSIGAAWVRRQRTCTLAVLVLGIAAAVSASDLPVAVQDSGSKEVDTLVAQLVSTRPAPYPSGYSGETPYHYATPAVQAATKKLKNLGPTIFPALVKHLGDDRYSYSYVSAAWGNCTVGDSVADILCDGNDMHSGYKVRKTPSGFAVYLSFKDYLRARGAEEWAAWAKSRSRLEIQLDFIDWCVKKEKERGFIDESQKKEVLGRYDSARRTVTKEYSELGNAANRSQSFGSETNRTPAATDSGR